MACLYKRKRSPFWWIKYRADDKPVYQSTGFKINNGPETRLARELESEKTLAERATGRMSSSEQWERWVETFLTTHYAQNEGSLTRFLTAWRSLRMFLDEYKIQRPRNLIREHCLKYFVWRKNPDVKNGKYRASHNTALLEMKTLSLVMEEAKRRGYTKDNPASKLGIKKAPRRLFPELTDEAMKLITDAIPNEEPEARRTFLQNSYLIARWHGVRLSETFLNPQTQVWQQEMNGELRWFILFFQKGGQQRPKLLHPALIPMMSDLKLKGAVQTYEPLTPVKRASRVWHDFLRRCGVKKLLPNACFHSLRVTAASRMARAGISERKTMEYLTHASTTVHAAYVRWRPEDMEECHGAL